MSQVQAVVPQVEAMIPKFVAMILQFVAMIPQVVAMAPQVEAFAKFIVSLNSSSDTHPQEMADAHHPRHGDPQSLGRARHRRLGRSHPVELRRDHLVADRHGHSDDKNNTLVTDPIAFYQLTPLKTESASSLPEISNWAAQEHEAFEKSYAAQPKQFGWIASQVKTRTPAECVIHYYRTKWHPAKPSDQMQLPPTRSSPSPKLTPSYLKPSGEINLKPLHANKPGQQDRQLNHYHYHHHPLILIHPS
ncbi:hypothetical protein PCASD_10224 [Puccinia coronata f. sp. avenae]|uniref:SANT domain-containing protein n=1 Tax=Puccinia coronata f. sp. avenae TaxID=200324 RepID=A0A2N5TPE2_9BASI|nr:hypothetical protein PCASD_20052 [Puccinia coronata f. sp. avenae]PLW35647.1 hypothetical protein PCASD_10224 [Puccinia coronata f. sp. avenae]